MASTRPVDMRAFSLFRVRLCKIYNLRRVRSAPWAPGGLAKWQGAAIGIRQLFENRFSDHGVHALVAVHQLRDIEIGSRAGQHVSVVARKSFFRN